MEMLAGPIALLPVAWMAQAVAATLLCWWYLRLLQRPQPAPATLPPVLVLVPVRGPQPGLHAFLSGLAAQDHPGPWRVVFALEGGADPALPAIDAFVAQRPGRAVRVLAGPAVRRGQKVQNLLAALATARAEETVVVTLDADIIPPPGMLSRLLRPVLSSQAPVSSGYRWSIPGGEGIGSQLVALADAGIGTLPRHAAWNPCWGGATALRRDALDLPAVWDRAVSDDLMLTRAARARGLVIYAPLDVRPPSPVNLPRLGQALRFGTRQYRVLRLHAPGAYAGALVAATVPVAGGAAALAGLGIAAGPALACLGLAVLMQGVRTMMRRAIARRVLPAEAATYACRLRDVWLLPLVPLFQLACLMMAGFGGRWLIWAGRRYRIGRDGAMVETGRVS